MGQAVNPRFGRAGGCYSPCGKLTHREWGNEIARENIFAETVAAPYCCPTAEDCPTGGMLEATEYVQVVRQHCPGASSYAYDHSGKTMTCPAGTEYDLHFGCPTGASSPPSPASHSRDVV